MIYDIIIIGGGISGLYSAYKLRELSPNSTYLILEKNKTCGGRVGNYLFYKSNIVIGAGIGRHKKDKLLLKLVKDLHLKTVEFPINPTYSPLIKDPININEIMKTLKSRYNNEHITFKEYFINIFGDDLYQKFKITCSYTDYENEDVYDTLFYYGMDDNYCCSIGNTIPWSNIISKLSDIIGLDKIKTSEDVIKIKNENDKYIVKSKNNNIYYSRKIIIASTIDTVRKLLPKCKIYKQIHGQSFLRVYGKFSKSSISIMKDCVKNTLIVPTPLQKIIAINPDKGIYMLAYSDNKNAKFLHKYIDNTLSNRNKFTQLIKESLGIDTSIKLTAIKSFYWKIGTHYYEPLSKDYKDRADYIYKAQHPERDILIVGEVVAFNHGWTEGALESIENGLNKKWIKNIDF